MVNLSNFSHIINVNNVYYDRIATYVSKDIRIVDNTYYDNSITTKYIDLKYNLDNFKMSYFEKFLIDDIIKNCSKNTRYINHYIKDKEKLNTWLADKLLFENFYFINNTYNHNSSMIMSYYNISKLDCYHHLYIKDGFYYLKNLKLIQSIYVDNNTFILTDEKKINLYKNKNMFNIDYEVESYQILNIDLSSLKEKREKKLKLIVD